MKKFLLIQFVSVLALVGFGSTTFGAEKRQLVYRMNQLEEVKKLAAAEDKPIAWIGTPARFLPFDKNPLGKGSHAATTYAIRLLQRDTIIIFSDGETENHQEPAIVDQALHSPKAHYDMPGVIILTPSLDKVIAKTFYKSTPQERAQEFGAILKKIRDKKSWHDEKSEEVKTEK